LSASAKSAHTPRPWPRPPAIAQPRGQFAGALSHTPSPSASVNAGRAGVAAVFGACATAVAPNTSAASIISIVRFVFMASVSLRPSPRLFFQVPPGRGTRTVPVISLVLPGAAPAIWGISRKILQKMQCNPERRPGSAA